jgi:hypothetical protein
LVLSSEPKQKNIKKVNQYFVIKNPNPKTLHIKNSKNKMQVLQNIKSHNETKFQTFLPRQMCGASLWFVIRFYLVRSHSTRNPRLEQSVLKYKIQNFDHFFHKIVLTISAPASADAGSNLLISDQHFLTFAPTSSLQKQSA